jgi:23S rRNA pseudouridine1911/1915/1917 synthase
MNDGFEYRETIGPAAAGREVTVYLSDRYRHTTEAAWRTRLEAGEVFIDGRVVDAGHVLRAGQSLVWRRPPWNEPDVPLAFAVLYRDEDLLAVAKPRGLPSVPNGGFLQHTLLYCVRRLFPEATPMHRLGRGTSGLVLFARTAVARRALAAAWREGRVEKDYRALVRGVPRERTFTIDARIGLVPHPRLGTVHAVCADGREASTTVRNVVPRAGVTRDPSARADGQAIADVRIATGRPHQIRIHMAAAGHPLVGDPVYAKGGGLVAEPGLPGDPGYRLHAYRLAFDHPTTGRRIVIECAPPPDLRS